MAKGIYGVMACDDGYGVGYNNGLPWPNIKSDMKFFKNLTSNSIVVMGRKTWNSIGSTSLPNRVNVVVSRDTELKGNFDHQFEYNTPRDLNYMLSSYSKMYNKDVFVIGGPQLLYDIDPYTDAIYITHIDGKYAADTYLEPEFFNNRFALSNLSLYHENDNDIRVAKVIKYTHKKAS